MLNLDLVNAPINSLSFGNVSFNLLRELFKRKMKIGLFPIGETVQIDAYDSIDKEMVAYLQSATDNRFQFLHKNSNSLKLWHIQGSESRIGKNQHLFTFHETDSITSLEKSLLNAQNQVFVSSKYTKDVFESAGVQDVKLAPLGFDEDFKVIDRKRFEHEIHFGLIGKLEHRKNTTRIIKAWAKLFGDKPGYRLSAAISNPFLNQSVFKNEVLKALGGKNYGNIGFVPHMVHNSEVNDFLNNIDIDLGGLSGSEGWNLPSFNATALGKWSIVLNATAHKDWANKDNSILIEPSRMKDSHDGTFFIKGNVVNQGQFFDLTDQEIEDAISFSVTKAKTLNTNGLKLQKEFTYSKTLDSILS